MKDTQIKMRYLHFSVRTRRSLEKGTSSNYITCKQLKITNDWLVGIIQPIYNKRDKLDQQQAYNVTQCYL